MAKTMGMAGCAIVSASFALMFSIAHLSSPTIVSAIFGESHREAYDRLELTAERVYWRRIVRGFLYYCYVAVAGVVLCLHIYRSKESLVSEYNLALQIHMCLGLGHWIVATIEDALSWKLLSGDMKDVRIVYLLALLYCTHHIFAISGYTFVLATEDLSFVGVCGFLFEIPVAIQTLREYAVAFGRYYVSPPPSMLGPFIRKGSSQQRDRSDVRFVTVFWALNILAAVIFRFTPIGIFWWGVFFWRSTISNIAVESQSFFYSVGVIFSLGNVAYMMLLSSYLRIDYIALRGDGERGKRDTEVAVESSAMGSSFIDIRDESVSTRK